MSDFEEQVGGTLAAAAEDAPDVVGLAAAARQRHRVRRQRRIAVGGVAAALVVAVSAVALGTRGDERSDLANDPKETPSADWQTVRVGDARVSLPPDWQPYQCEGHDDEPPAPVYAAPGEDPCADGTGTLLYDASTFAPLDAAGVVSRRDGAGRAYWSGYVSVGEFVLSVTSDDRDLTRQILATARLDGQPLVDGSQWVSFERTGIGYDVPAFWGVGEKGDRSGYAVCAEPGAGNQGTGDQLDDRHYRYDRFFGDLRVTLTAPTQAVAEIVWASLNVAPDAVGGDCAEEDFNIGLLPPEGGPGDPVEGEEPALDTITFGDIVLEVPADWTMKDDCGGVVEVNAATGCSESVDNDGVRFLEAATFRPAMAEGVVVQSGEDEEVVWGGYELRGDYVVFITSRDKAQVEDLLSRVRR